MHERQGISMSESSSRRPPWPVRKTSKKAMKVKTKTRKKTGNGGDGRAESST